jgi:hypothetical protein
MWQDLSIVFPYPDEFKLIFKFMLPLMLLFMLAFNKKFDGCPD